MEIPKKCRDCKRFVLTGICDCGKFEDGGICTLDEPRYAQAGTDACTEYETDERERMDGGNSRC